MVIKNHSSSLKMSAHFNAENYVGGKVHRLREHIVSQNFSSPPQLVLHANGLDALVTLNLALACKKQFPDIVGDIIVVRFNSVDSLGVIDYCKGLGVAMCGTIDVSPIVDHIARKASNCFNPGRKITQKFKNDLTRSILYYIAGSKKGIVLTCINESDLKIGNFSKSSDRVGDWNLVGDINNSEVRELAQFFNIPQQFIDAQDNINSDFERSHTISYSFINQKNNTDGSHSDVKKYAQLKDKLRHKFSYPHNINNKVKAKVTTNTTNSTNQDEPLMYTSPYAMDPELVNLLGLLRGLEEFNVHDWITEKIMSFMEYLRKSGINTVVVAVSGGVDSAAVLALALEAKRRYPDVVKNVVALAIPISSTKAVQNRAYENCDALGTTCYTVNLTDEHELLCDLVSKEFGFDRTPFCDGNFRSSLRAPLLYYVARMYGGLVLGTGNMSEDGHIGYCCKSGDNLVDLQLIADLYKAYVYIVAQKLGVIESILTAQPTADLSEGQTDEGELGFSYDVVELHMRLLKLSNEDRNLYLEQLSESALATYNIMAAKIDRVHNANKHKFEMAKII